MRRALQYASITDRPLALHCEEPTLSHGGAGARGTRLRRARLRGLSVGRRVRDGRARPLARRIRERPRPRPAPLGGRVGRRAAPRAGGRRRGQRRGDAAPPRPHRRRRALARPEREDEPAAARRGATGVALLEAVRDGTIEAIATDHAPHARAREGRAVRGGAVRRHRPRDGVRVALHAPRRARACCRSRRCSSGCPPARRGSSGSTGRGSRWARRRTSSCSTSSGEWTVGEQPFRSRSVNSWLLGATLNGAVRMTLAGGRVAFE